MEEGKGEYDGEGKGTGMKEGKGTEIEAEGRKSK
jgi:hypothetical protein